METKSYSPFIGLRDVMELTTLSRATVYKSIHKAGFPKPEKISSRSIWRTEEVMRWMNAAMRGEG